MELQVVTYRLMGMTTEQYGAFCDRIAPSIAMLPGLMSKVWLADESTNTYGGLYTWRDRAATESFLKGDLFRLLVDHPHLADLTSRVFSVLEAPSAVTAPTRPVAA